MFTEFHILDVLPGLIQLPCPPSHKSTASLMIGHLNLLYNLMLGYLLLLYMLLAYINKKINFEFLI